MNSDADLDRLNQQQPAGMNSCLAQEIMRRLWKSGAVEFEDTARSLPIIDAALAVTRDALQEDASPDCRRKAILAIATV